ncbi:MAG: hypothetical protein ACYDH0_10870, partial [Candidatus Aminicenantales bacterium]
MMNGSFPFRIENSDPKGGDRASRRHPAAPPVPHDRYPYNNSPARSTAAADLPRGCLLRGQNEGFQEERSDDRGVGVVFRKG